MEEIKLITPGSIFNFEVQSESSGERIDIFLANKFKGYSRSFFEKMLEKEFVSINKKIIFKKSFILKTGDIVTVNFPEEKERTSESEKLELIKNLDVKIIFENKHFAIINKPAGLTVHPSGKQIIENIKENINNKITLVDWILQNIKEISNIGFNERPGIVHRLDKDTSGLMIIPKNNCAHAIFADLFKERKIKKTYLAIVHGHPDKTGTIDFDIARNPHEKIKMTHVTSSNISKICGKSRNAVTEYEVVEYFESYQIYSKNKFSSDYSGDYSNDYSKDFSSNLSQNFSLVKAYPKTGRTHQIRVHFSSIGHPLLGDAVYGKNSKTISRHALHALEIEFEFEGEKFKFSTEMPKDFIDAINKIKIKF